MNKLPLMFAGAVALATVAATAAQAQQGQGGGYYDPQTQAYTPPEVGAPVGASNGVAVIAGQTWEVQPVAPVYTNPDVDRGPQTGRGGIDNNTP
ncbi:MAG TPA: hypothetical protein VGG27_21075 [Magnetospirillaceae bacterium]|jgi:hypothetical protein